jgi:hypothetical protein
MAAIAKHQIEKTMKALIGIVVAGCVAMTAARGEPLNKKEVNADAKWLLHLDLDQFRATQVGKYLSGKVLDEALKKPQTELKNNFNFDLDWTKIKSITVYGSEYQSPKDPGGILLVNAQTDMVDAVLSLIESQMKLGNFLKCEMVATNPCVMYQFNQDAYLVRPQTNLIIMGKRSNEVAQARQVVLGQSSNILRSKAFAGYPEVPCPFVFLALAEAFNQDTTMPPQAEILKKADGGRLVLGESPDKLIVNLDLRVKDKEVSQQIKQVAQGLIALATLTMAQNPDAQGVLQLIQNIQIKNNDHLVTFNLEYPVAKAMTLLGEVVDKNQKEKGNHSAAPGASPKKETLEKPESK